MVLMMKVACDFLRTKQGKQKGLRAARPTARLMTCPDLLRLTRQILQVAELLPWPVKDRLFQVRLHLSAQGTVDTKFSGGDSLEPAHSWVGSLNRTISHSRFRAITAASPLYHLSSTLKILKTSLHRQRYNASLSHSSQTSSTDNVFNHCGQWHVLYKRRTTYINFKLLHCYHQLFLFTRHTIITSTNFSSCRHPK
jgi:hypothetical protein